MTFSTDVLGFDVLPWQAWLYDRALETQGNRWRRRTVLALAARQNGKTKCTTIRVLGGMVLWGEVVIGAAQNRDVALESWTDALESAQEAGLEPWDIHHQNGRESFRIGKRSRYKVTASTRGGGRGLTGDLVVLDELREATDWKAYGALEKIRRARPNSQFWSISNEGDMSSVVLRTLSGQGETWMGDTTSPIGFYSWSADPIYERSDPRGWVQANPALGHLIELETIEAELRTDPPDVFETEVLCRPVMVLRPYLPEGVWMTLQERRQPIPSTPGTTFMAVEAGPELRHATIAVAWVRPDGRVGVDVAASFDESDGPILARMAPRLTELAERHRPAVVAAQTKTPAEALAGRCVPAGTDIAHIGSADLQRAAAGFYEAAVGRLVVHMADPSLDSAIQVASADAPGQVPTRRSNTADIDACLAVILAHHSASTRPTKVVAASWVAY